ncbi:MAG: hypothetical protein OEZ04_11600 [Nitrospinota bacterium]|nr:hypothetical protein [Nitrospinota bacterium]
MDIEKIECLTEREKKIARRLLDDGSITTGEFREFLVKREKIDTVGKMHLGDLLIKDGHITRETLDDFFTENNRLYLDLLGQMVDGGYISKEQYATILKDKASKLNVVAALENSKIMTRENFIRLCANRMDLFKLGEWLVMRKKIEPEILKRALAEQHVNNLEDYLLHHDMVAKERIAELVDVMGLH